MKQILLLLNMRYINMSYWVKLLPAAPFFFTFELENIKLVEFFH